MFGTGTVVSTGESYAIFGILLLVICGVEDGVKSGRKAFGECRWDLGEDNNPKNGVAMPSSSVSSALSSRWVLEDANEWNRWLVIDKPNNVDGWAVLLGRNDDSWLTSLCTRCLRVVMRWLSVLSIHMLLSNPQLFQLGSFTTSLNSHSCSVKVPSELISHAFDGENESVSNRSELSCLLFVPVVNNGLGE